MRNIEDLKQQFNNVKNKYRLSLNLTDAQFHLLSKELESDEELLYVVYVNEQKIFSERYLLLTNKNFIITSNSKLIKKIPNSIKITHYETEQEVVGQLELGDQLLNIYNLDINTIKQLLPKHVMIKKETIQKEEKEKPNYFIRFGITFFFIALIIYLVKGSINDGVYISQRFIVCLFWSFFFFITSFQLIILGIIRKDK